MADYTGQKFYLDIFRRLLSLIDVLIYSLISVLYQIFFNVSNATLISGEVIKNFYSRVQLVLGIIVMFKLAISLINGILNPDSISDNNKGFFGIIKRIVLSLVMLVLIVPLNIPTSDLGDSGSYNSQLNNNGILFGTLYELQRIVLSQNTLARLVLGIDTGTASEGLNESAKESGRELATIILKCFVSINLKKDDGDLQNSDDWMCQDTDSQDIIMAYLDPTISPAGVFKNINASCEVEDSDGVAEIEEGEDYYVFRYSVLFSTIAGVLFIIIFLGFILDIAIRAFKLAILRLISPIPIISYIDPKSEQNGAFGAWVKSVTSTYLDLFLRLAVVYFILFIVQQFATEGIIMDVGTGLVGLFSKVFILLGLFFFAKEAPGFIQSSLGIQSKGPGKGMFSGIGKMMGAIGAVRGAGSAAIEGWRASRLANELSDDSRKYGFRRRVVNPFLSGVASGVSGGASALLAAGNSNDHQYRRARNRVDQLNRERMEYAREGGTLWGSLRPSRPHAPWHPSTNPNARVGYERLKAQESALKKQAEEAKQRGALFKNVLSEAKSKATTHRDTRGTLKLADGTTYNGVNYAAFEAARQNAINTGSRTFKVADSTGNLQDIDISSLDQKAIDDLLDSNTASYISGVNDSTIGCNNDNFKSDVAKAYSSTYVDSSGSMINFGDLVNDPNNGIDSLGATKQFMGHYSNVEYNANNDLDEVRAHMPAAKANADRSNARRNVK